MLPMYFYDYTQPWDNPQFEDVERNEFGLVDPDEHKPSECIPKQVYTEDVTMTSELRGDVLTISVETPEDKKRLVTGVFDLPYERDFAVTADKSDVKVRKIYDHWTGNSHLFIDLGKINSGKTTITFKLEGIAREVVPAEDVKDAFGVMWFGTHAYLRSLEKDLAIRVEMDAPEGAYLRLISGEKVRAENGRLVFTVNHAWDDEAPLLYNYPRALFRGAIRNAKVSVIGPTTCSRWSGQ